MSWSSVLRTREEASDEGGESAFVAWRKQQTKTEAERQRHVEQSQTKTRQSVVRGSQQHENVRLAGGVGAAPRARGQHEGQPHGGHQGAAEQAAERGALPALHRSPFSPAQGSGSIDRAGNYDAQSNAVGTVRRLLRWPVQPLRKNRM